MSQRPRVQQHQWVGVYTADFTLDGVHARCLRLAEVLLANKWNCLVAHDTRFMGVQFARYAYRVLESRGVQVSFCPTPAPFPAVELALEQRRVDTALLLSAGNLPYWYCGMIVLAPPLGQPLLDASPAEQPAMSAPAELFTPTLE